MKKNQWVTLLVGIIFLLAGCVDVESGQDSSSGAIEARQVEGKAVKGVLGQARVSLYALEQGQRRFIADGMTDNSGHFSLEIPAQSAPLLVEVAVAGDGSSTMVCDAPSGCAGVTFGEQTVMPAELTLSAVVMPEELDGELIAITPVTHLLAEMAQALPQGIDGPSLQVLRSQLSRLLALSPDFAFQPVPDVTSASEFNNAAAGARLHALVSAFFAEAATLTQQPVADVIASYRTAMLNNGGQLPVSGDYSMAWVLMGASMVADHIGGAEATALSADLQARLQSLSGEFTTATPLSVSSEEDLNRALVALDDLDHYLGMAGIDGDGAFFSEQAYQVEWLYTEEMKQLLGKTFQVGALAFIVSAAGDQMVAEQGNPLDLSGMLGPGISAIYDKEAGTLTVAGTADGQTLDIVIDMTSLWVLENTDRLDYAVSGSIVNSGMLAELQGTLEINTYETDFIPVLMAANTWAISGSLTDRDAFMASLAELLTELHARATVVGEGSITSLTRADTQFSGSINAWGELNLPNLGQTGDYLAFRINSGLLESPAGDRIFSHSGRPALDVAVGDQAVMAADFGFQAFGLPEVHVQANGSLFGLSALSGRLNDVLALQQTSGQLEFTKLLEAILDTDLGVLQLAGSGSVEIPADNLLYRFNLENTSLTASLPNSTEAALTLHVSGLNGGYIYSGDSLVATVVFDWARTGAMIHLVNGETRAYLLGPITDIFPEDLLAALLQTGG